MVIGYLNFEFICNLIFGICYLKRLVLIICHLRLLVLVVCNLSN
ncbi:hypothetical protein D1AOALGA4SA_12119 [Olavius algarvensis Delta 1 endosymbiont]|nr:hypothetical protein D1AOALGA4SA_12119 [Olavius algarvensis Delta 1 endosymbiont]